MCQGNLLTQFLEFLEKNRVKYKIYTTQLVKISLQSLIKAITDASILSLGILILSVLSSLYLLYSINLESLILNP